MGGGLMQLVAYGAQDIYLTGNPQITFWKVVYRRHTNFARECIEQTISGSSVAADGNRGTVTVSRNGDLLGQVYVTSTGAVAGAGDALVKDVEVQIGGQKIDKHTQEWMQLWAELTTPDSKAAAYRAMTGVSGTQGSSGTGAYMTQVPLQFWFCRNPGLALPLIALQYHEVKLVFNWGVGNGVTCKVMCDYVYLDTDERRRFAQVSHEYLIEQLQYQSGSANASHKLTLNHPVKALYWTNDADAVGTRTANLKLNGHDRFAKQEKEYFQLRQPMEHHTAVPGQNVPVVQRPTLLATPLDSGITINETTSGDLDGLTKVTIGTSTITYAASQTIPFKVGDVINILVAPGEATTDTAAVLGHQAAVSSVTSTVVTFGPATLLALADADVVRVQIIARTQNPLCRTSSMATEVNMYSFALEPEEHQPSGTCNFSRIDTASLEFSSSLTLSNIYAVNYNVLRIMSGMGGLAYSN